jgi:hypothetical protein
VAVENPPRAANQGTGFGLGFVLLKRADPPQMAALTAQSEHLGLGAAEAEPIDPAAEGVRLYSFGLGVQALIALIPAPHPDARSLCTGILSPDIDEATRAPAHLIVTVLEPQGSLAERDAISCRVLAAVSAATDACATMLGHGTMLYRSDFFGEVVASAGPGELPLEVCIDITITHEPGERVSLLTHGLQRYDCEEFLVAAKADAAEDAMDFTWGMARWVISDPDRALPTGDTVGRTADEQITIERVDSPSGDGSTVVRLEL